MVNTIITLSNSSRNKILNALALYAINTGYFILYDYEVVEEDINEILDILKYDDLPKIFTYKEALIKKQSIIKEVEKEIYKELIKLNIPYKNYIHINMEEVNLWSNLEDYFFEINIDGDYYYVLK